MSKEFRLIYNDTRPMRLMELFFYNAGNIDISYGKEIRVSETEYNYLITLKNGSNPIFIDKKLIKIKTEKEVI
jgi:hypothetical protein